MTKKKILRFAILILILITACSKNIVPGLKPGKTGNEYDQAAFNYIYVEGLHQKLMGNMGDALEYFEQALVVNPESDAACFQIAQILLGNGNVSAGKRYLIKAAETAPGNQWYSMLLANIYHQENNLDSAILYYENVVRINPFKEDLVVSLASLYNQKKEYGKASTLLKKYDEKYGPNEKTTLALVENLTAEKKYDEARRKINELLAENPDDIVYTGYMASIYRSEGDYDSAKKVYDELIKRNPDNPGIQLSLCEFLISDKNFKELFELINIVIANQKIPKEEKLKLFSELIESKEVIEEFNSEMEEALKQLEIIYSGDDIMILLRPEFLIKENRAKEAADRLEEIIKLKPDNYFAWEKLLLVYYDLKDFVSLLRRGEQCATKFNRSVIAKMLYATAAMENKDYDIALEELRKADILAGDNSEIKLQIITLKADAFYRMKNYEEAFKLYDEALKLNNNDLTVLNNYAYFLAEQNMNLKEAEKMAKTVVEKEKNNNTFLDTYAWVLYKRGKLNEALRIMENIIASDIKGDAEYYEHYGYILKKMRKCKDAVMSWEKAILLDKNKTYLNKEIESCIK